MRTYDDERVGTVTYLDTAEQADEYVTDADIVSLIALGKLRRR